jgi:TRAP-type C4-dicarboxylate transport system permease small subunit
MIRTIILVIGLGLFIGVNIGVFLLQNHLSKKVNKWYGLILPGINLFFIVVILAGTVLYTIPVGTTTTISENSEVISTYTYTVDSNGNKIETAAPPVTPSTILQVLWQSLNITILVGWHFPVLMIIYVINRRKLSKHKEIKKMQILDL